MLRWGEANLVSEFTPALLCQELRSDARRIFIPAYVLLPDIYDAVLAVQQHLFGRQPGPTRVATTGAVHVIS